MKIYSNGKDRVLTGVFPTRFKLLNNGEDVPFIRTGKESIRLTGSVPFGELDVQEFIVNKKPKEQPKQLDAMYLSIINRSDVEKIVNSEKELKETEKAINESLSELGVKNKELYDFESKNAGFIEQTNETLKELAKVFGNEIQADRDEISKTEKRIQKEILDSSEISDAKLKRHETAKNPHNITKETIGLGNVDNTSDIDKPVSKATKKALDKKADKTDIEELDKKIKESGKKQDSIIRSIENANLYGGVGGNELPSGGKTGQVLKKKSSKTGDYEWGEAGFDGVHNDLDGRDAQNAHPISSITGLQGDLIDIQQQIDAITLSSDVTDVVGTYAQLQAYDTSTLPPNSIIKVLQDESRNNETTYYRWVVTGGVGSWVLIGEEGPYYTKSEIQTMLLDYEKTSNKVTSLSAQSTDTQYPSAKCMWDIVGDIEATINAIRGV